ncbi:unnamed protein product [Phyllotreta striolata]|uniref:RING-type domain-containing protein n=1 Tax=Phyllotreta striolata TaxID=444603 RepID=A0A9N9XIZ8_PHYSR|nr:unnamed protein product [Phyllotreta striolata]
MDSKCKKILLKDLNSVITCKLCQGYFIDATALTECLHVFCRACILRHFENSKTDCPICNTVYKKKTPACFKADPQIQSLVYKVVPSLFARESQRRDDFYRSTGVRASSSCSDDSVIERERDLINDQEETISNFFGDKTRFINTEDLISLSLEYYQADLDETGEEKKSNNRENNNRKLSYINDTDEVVGAKITNDGDCNKNGDKDVTNDENGKNCDKRFLQCPAAVSMKHLQKFIRMKFGLTADHRVDIIYKGEVLKNNFSLIDVAYTFKWKKEKPLRFFYRIFTPQKVRPIKIRLEGEQLQVVPVKSDAQRPVLNTSNDEKIERPKSFLDELEDQNDHKKRLFEHLKLQPNQTEKETKKVPEKSPQKDCVFEYQEPDLEEIKRFAEIRDREWAMQKKLDEESKRINEEETFTYHISKKRKKNKHSKNESNTHKKRKLHAEIASNEEDLKLKVKITNNGHKHKHHKSSNQQLNEKDKSSTQEMSSKEKLLQMRQVRHKHIPSDEKKIQTVPSLILSKDVNRIIDKPRVEDNISKPQNISNKPVQNIEPVKVSEDIKKLKIKVPEPSTNVTESAVLLKQQTQPTSTSPKIGAFLESSSPNKTNFINVKEKEWTKKIMPSVQLERNTQTEKQAIKVQKTFQSYADKYRTEKVQQNKIESAKMSKETPQPKTDINKITTNNNKLLEIKIEHLRQRCTFEPKQPDKPEKKVVFNNAKNKIIPHYPPGFTTQFGDNFNQPADEYSYANSPKTTRKTSSQTTPASHHPSREIKKSVNLKSGISIIPKLPERCDNIGALDLSNKSPDSSPRNSPKIESTNGVTITNRQLTTLNRTEKNPALSNLQMLSKVATEHPTLNNQNVVVVNNKPRPQMPSLQTLKIPNLPMKTSNLQKLPKLNEIQKFRPQIRSVRPNQNQNIRNIPNPSALIRQHQTQNRITIGTQADSPSKSVATTAAAAPAQAPVAVSPKDNGVKAMDIAVQEKKEISV